MGNGALPHGPSYRAHPRLYLRVRSPRCLNSVAIGAIADIARSTAAPGSDANDPILTLAVLTGCMALGFWPSQNPVFASRSVLLFRASI